MSELDPSFQNSSPTKTPKNSLDEEIDEDEESILDDQSIDDVGTIEENCDDNDDPFDWELEVPIDVSIDSDSSQDDSDVSEFEIQEEAEEEVREDVFDKIIDAFTVKRRKAIIDLDQDSDLVDYEESQKRLFILATIFATILGIIATTLLILQLPNWSLKLIIYQPSLKQKENMLTHPHIIVFFWNGEIEAFKQNGSRLEHSWTFQLPKVQDETGYIPYAELGQLFILNSNKAKNTILLSKNSDYNLTHSTIPNSQIPQNFFYSPRFVQVGHLLWILGGKREKIEIYINNDAVFYNFGKHSKTLIWNTRRNVYYPGPDLLYDHYPDYSSNLDHTLGRGHPISLNRTHVMILQVEVFSECLQGWIYSFSSFQWTVLDQCIHEVNTVADITDYLVPQEFEIKGATFFDKNGWLKSVLLINGYDRGYGSETLSHVILMEHNTLTSTKIEYNFELPSPDSACNNTLKNDVSKNCFQTVFS